MFNRVLIVTAIIASIAPVPPAQAAGSDNPFLAQILGRLYRDGQSFACFSRQYDDTHLTAHPTQRVTYVKVLVDGYFRTSPLARAQGSYSYQVSLAFRFRDRAETLTGVAECGGGKPRDSLRDGAHCAGPQNANAHLALDGRRVLVVTLSEGPDLWTPGPMDQRHDTVKNPFGSDDKVFRLIRTKLRECEDLAFERQKPLRPHEP